MDKKYKAVIGIPCWMNAQLSKKAIESALVQPNSFVIAIDNASPDKGETKKVFDNLEKAGHKNLLLIRSTENTGWIGGINMAIEESPECEYFVMMNSDVEIKEDFWEKIEPHFKEEDVGAVGPVGNNVSGLHNYELPNYPDHHEVKFLIGYCFVVRKSIIDKTGGLDPIFGWGLSDDLDMSLRIRKLDYRLFIARDCQVFHHGSKGIALKYKSDEEYKQDLEDKNKIFIDKWGQDEFDNIMKVEPHCSGTIGVPHLEMVHSDFMHSFTQLRKPSTSIVNFVKGSLITKARNDIVKAMKGDWLLFIDSDMTFPADALDKLLVHLESGIDIVAGLCFRRVPDYNPTLYMQLDGQLKWKWLHEYPKDSLFEVDATGSAFILIKKKVFDKMPYPWYEYKQDLSEDLYFCHKAKELGFKIHIDSPVKIGHLASFPVDEKFFEEYKKNKTFVE